MSSNYTAKYRPVTFEEVVGQSNPVKLLKAIAKSPDESNRCIILCGGYGTGKSTLARVFARALTCESFHKTGKICGTCRTCKNLLTANRYYYEFDSSVVGSADEIKDLQPLFDEQTDYYRVIVFDEAQVIDKKGQAALLKVIEEPAPKTFFIFCTTDPDDLMKTIHSRSTVVEFSLVDDVVMRNHLQSIIKKEEKPALPEDVLDKILLAAQGHVRDAVTLLNSVITAEDPSILALPVDEIRLFFLAFSKRDQAGMTEQINRIVRYPNAKIKACLNHVTYKLVETLYLKSQNEYTPIVQNLGQGVLKILKLVSEPWVRESLKDSSLTHAFLLTLASSAGGQQQ